MIYCRMPEGVFHFRIARLKDVEFYPRFAKERLLQLPLTTERVVEQEIIG